MNFDAIALFLYHEAEKRIENAVLEALRGPGIALPTDFPPEDTIIWWIYHHQEPVIITSRDQDKRFPCVMEIFVKYGISSSCILPLTTAYGRLGSLCFISQSLQEYTAEEIRYLQLVTDQVALAVDNALRDVQQSREALFLAEGQKLGHIGNWARQVASGEVLFSQESLRMFGFREGTSRLALDGILSRVHPEDRAALQNTIEEASRQAADFESEFRTIRDDGSLRHIHVVGHPLENEQGRLAEFVGTHIDITEQYRSRKELEQALAEIRALKDQLYQKNLPCAKRWMRPQCLRTSSAKVKRCKKC